MDFAFDARTEELRARLLAFMDEHVYPAERVAHEQRAGLDSPWENVPVVEELKAEARRQGLWNLFLPDSEHGAGLTNLQYAPLAEIMGRSPQIAPTVTNCAAPDTGNMEVLAQFGDERQKKQWLEPLLAGEIRSAFAMTEPDVDQGPRRGAVRGLPRGNRSGDGRTAAGRAPRDLGSAQGGEAPPTGLRRRITCDVTRAGLLVELVRAAATRPRGDGPARSPDGRPGGPHGRSARSSRSARWSATSCGLSGPSGRYQVDRWCTEPKW
ncbi:hypothetical protein SGRIM128S_07309 [Streptomyces griseomycini]